MFAPVAWANSKSVWGKLAVIIATLPMLFLFVLMGSLGSIIIMVLLIVIFFPAKLYVIKALYIALLLFTILSIYALINQNIANQLYQNAADIHQNWEDKMEYDGRNKIFTELIDMIVEKPFIGYGAYSFYKKTDFWPHNNILGIWVDHGMLVVAAYIFFLCITIYYCLIVRKIHLQKIPQDMLTKLAVSFAMMSIFLHGKGFVHDTWYTLGLWLYSGCLFGLLSNPDLLQQKYRSRINNNHHLSHSLIGRDVRLITKIKT
jgi:O-antigen ligase